MKREESAQEITGIGDEAVRAKTGKTWQEWFDVLDAAGAAEMTHKEIATYLSEQQGVGDWWCQMVTVGYERARLGREKHQTSRGFQVSASKTINAPLAQVYRAWVDDETRRGWLPDRPLAIRGATENKSVRLDWDEQSAVRVEFYDKGAARSQVVAQHDRLTDQAQAQAMKQFWQEKLARLKQFLEGSSGRGQA